MRTQWLIDKNGAYNFDEVAAVTKDGAGAAVLHTTNGVALTTATKYEDVVAQLAPPPDAPPAAKPAGGALPAGGAPPAGDAAPPVADAPGQ